MKKLRIGLLLESVHSDKYVEELVHWCRNRPELELSHLIVHPYRQPSQTRWRAIAGVERMLMRWSAAHRDHYAVRDLAGTGEPIIHIQPIVSRHECRFSDHDVAKIKALDLDLLVSCGSRTPRGAIVRASRLGVIASLHGGFWECYERRPQTSFVIRRLGEERGSDEALLGGSFRTRFYYSLNRANVCKKSVAHLKNVLASAAVRGAWPAGERRAVFSPEDAHREPGVLHCLAYAGKLAARIALKAIGRIPLLKERFGVSIVAPGERRAAPLARGREWADPFLCTRGGRTYCFVEEINPQTKKGHIAALELVGTRLRERGVALAEPFHLSFPYLFEYRGELYMCPETSAAREIRVYRCKGFPLQWRLEKTLMHGVSAADTVLFARHGKWWMLTNIDPSESGDHNSELYLFSADSPLASSWLAHPQNPILIDSIGGRNGGLVIGGERLFRLGQCQGFDRYGESLRVYEIREISPSRYREELLAEIRPPRGAGIVGTHHLSTDGRTTVIDHVSSAFAS